MGKHITANDVTDCCLDLTEKVLRIEEEYTIKTIDYPKLALLFSQNPIAVEYIKVQPKQLTSVLNRDVLVWASNSCRSHCYCRQVFVFKNKRNIFGTLIHKLYMLMMAPTNELHTDFK